MSKTVNLPTAQVDRAAVLGRQEFYDRMRPVGQPVVVTAATETWFARTRWSFEFFANRYGADKVTVTDCLLRPSLGVNVTLAQYLAYVQEPAGHPLERLRLERGLTSPFYAYGYKPFIAHPELATDFELPAYAEDWCDHLPQGMREGVYPNGQQWLLLSPAGARSRTHRDGGATIAWFAQILGTKTVVLYPPTDGPHLYDGAVEPIAPDLTAFPGYAYAHPLMCRLTAGDLLFLPPDWYHFVVSDSASITISGNIVNHVNFGDYVRLAYKGDVARFLSALPLPHNS